MSLDKTGLKQKPNYWTSVLFSVQGMQRTQYRWCAVISRPYYNGRAYATVLRPSVVCNVMWAIVAKRCVLEQKLLLTAWRKSYMRNRLVLKWMS